MSAKLFYLLEELQGNYSDKDLKDIITTFQDEVVIDDIFIDQHRAKNAFNEQNEEFYNQLSILFLQDLNETPEMYFICWEPIIGLFREYEKCVFLEKALLNYSDGDADDYINGMQYLDNGSPEIAMFYFNRIEHYIASYFVGLCYLELEINENSIIAFEIFLDELIETMKVPTLNNESGLTIAKWNTLNDLGYLYNRIEEFQKAKDCYQKGLEIFSLEETFKINNSNDVENSFDEFAIWTNNYVLALEMTNLINECFEVLQFAISKRPLDIYFQKQLQNFKEKQNSNSFAEGILKQAFKKKQPFNIRQFEMTKKISKEKLLEDLILEQIKYGFTVFGKSLELYKDDYIHGRQYNIKSINGFLDLLLIDKTNNQLYIVELKRNEAGTEVVEQIEKYIEGLSKEMNRKILGIICLHKPDNSLSELVKTKKNIELYTYEFNFKKIE